MIDIEKINALKENLLEKYANYLSCEIELVLQYGDAEKVNGTKLARAKSECVKASNKYYQYLIGTEL